MKSIPTKLKITEERREETINHGAILVSEACHITGKIARSK
jgi:hypothetical protein